MPKNGPRLGTSAKARRQMRADERRGPSTGKAPGCPDGHGRMAEGRTMFFCQTCPRSRPKVDC